MMPAMTERQLFKMACLSKKSAIDYLPTWRESGKPRFDYYDWLRSWAKAIAPDVEIFPDRWLVSSICQKCHKQLTEEAFSCGKSSWTETIVPYCSAKCAGKGEQEMSRAKSLFDGE